MALRTVMDGVNDMVATIIQLNNFRSGARSAQLDLYFPVVYRETGFGWQDGGKSGPDHRYPYLDYTLSNAPGAHVAEQAFTAIDYLDPTRDDGWVVVRHHRSKDLLDGYIDGSMDFKETPELRRIAYQTDTGIFTIARRRAVAGCPNHLLIYQGMVPAGVTHIPDLEWKPWTRVVHRDGSVSNDDSVLFPA